MKVTQLRIHNTPNREELLDMFDRGLNLVLNASTLYEDPVDPVRFEITGLWHAGHCGRIFTGKTTLGKFVIGRIDLNDQSGYLEVHSEMNAESLELLLRGRERQCPICSQPLVAIRNGFACPACEESFTDENLSDALAAIA